jgi:hypothetical protein
MRQYEDKFSVCFCALVSDQLIEIFKKTDNHHDGRARQPDKEENGKEIHPELQ